MRNQETIDDVAPKAAPTEEDVRQWRALPEDERRRRLAQAVEDGFSSGVSDKSIEDIIAEAEAELSADQS